MLGKALGIAAINSSGSSDHYNYFVNIVYMQSHIFFPSIKNHLKNGEIVLNIV
jgi:hypothetical protein